MANHHFPWIPNEQRTEAIPSLLHFLCDNLLFIIFFSPLSKNCTGPLGILRIFKIFGRIGVILKSIAVGYHQICQLEMRTVHTQLPNWKVCSGHCSVGTEIR